MALFDLGRKKFTNWVSTFICKLSYVLIFLIHQKTTTTFRSSLDLLEYPILLYTLFISGLCFKIYYTGHNILKEIYKIHSHKFLIFYLGKKLSSHDNNTIIHHFNSYALPVK